MAVARAGQDDGGRGRSGEGAGGGRGGSVRYVFPKGLSRSGMLTLSFSLSSQVEEAAPARGQDPAQARRAEPGEPGAQGAGVRAERGLAGRGRQSAGVCGGGRGEGRADEGDEG